MSDLIQNTAELRSFNTKKIIGHLRFNPPITKKELADQLNLSFATVSNICNQLVDDAILQDMDSEAFNGGRIPKLISINPFSKCILGFDLIQNGAVKVAIINLKGEIVRVSYDKLPGTKNLPEIIQLLYQKALEVLTQQKVGYENLLGIGVAAPGIFNKNSRTIVNSTNPVFENQPLQEMIEQVFNLPVCIENESNLLVVATALAVSRDFKNKDLIYIYIGDGLGTGIISNGKVVTGNSGLGGEISHIPIGEHSFDCYCGHTGCIETELSLQGFLKKYYQKIGQQPGNADQDWQQFLAAVIAQKPEALSVIAENGKLIGRLISVLVNIFDPEVIYIGGITESIFDYLYPHVMSEAKSRIIVNQMRDVSVFSSRDYETLIFRGCSEMVFDEWKPQVTKIS
jgi:predicted NBD/HSP70 family sugar kinase